jgi:hypothetical protein
VPLLIHPRGGCVQGTVDVCCKQLVPLNKWTIKNSQWALVRHQPISTIEIWTILAANIEITWCDEPEELPGLSHLSKVNHQSQLFPGCIRELWSQSVQGRHAQQWHLVSGRQ